jgi:hypothetical protein
MESMGSSPHGLATPQEPAVGASVAFEEFFRVEQRRLHEAVFAITGTRSEAEDIGQEAFLRVWERWDRVSGRFLVYEWKPYLGEESLPNELYLREALEIDGEDNDALVHFTETWGCLSGVGRDPLNSLPRMAPQSARRLRGTGITRFAREHDLLPTQVVSIETVRFHLLVMQAMTRHWIAHQTGDDVRAAWERSGLLPDLIWDLDPPEEYDLWLLFVECLNAALRPFQVAVELELPGDMDRRRTGCRSSPRTRRWPCSWPTTWPRTPSTDDAQTRRVEGRSSVSADEPSSDSSKRLGCGTAPRRAHVRRRRANTAVANTRGRRNSRGTHPAA